MLQWNRFLCNSCNFGLHCYKAGNYKKPIVCVHPDISNFTDYLQRAPQTTATATDCPQPNNEPLATVNDGVRKALNCAEVATTARVEASSKGTDRTPQANSQPTATETTAAVQTEPIVRAGPPQSANTGQKQQQQFKSHPLYMQARSSVREEEEDQFYEANTCLDHVYDTPANVPSNQNGEEEEDEWDDESEF
ncbi:hypothetical protein niasHT_033787 [Heterodera trifolii]|uniref:Uncharacterized protein n=1 Tax=Heterodera trifolii TaxID=157864 RepID=A0ABD2J7D3_9BILA